MSDHGVHGMVELLGELWQRIENAYQIVFDAREGSHVQVQQTIGLQGDVRFLDPGMLVSVVFRMTILYVFIRIYV